MTRTTPRHERPDADVDADKETSPSKRPRRHGKNSVGSGIMPDSAEQLSGPHSVQEPPIANLESVTTTSVSTGSAMAASLTSGGTSSMDIPSTDQSSSAAVTADAPEPAVSPIDGVAHRTGALDKDLDTSVVDEVSASATRVVVSREHAGVSPSTPPRAIVHNAGVQSSPVVTSPAVGSANSSVAASPARAAVSCNKVSLRRPATALPLRPVESMPPDTRSYFDAGDLECFDGLRKYSDPQSSAYAIGVLPERLGWGPSARGGDDRKTYITQGHTKVKVYILGELLKLDETVNPRGSRALLSMLPLVQGDAMRLDELLTSFATSGAAPVSNTWERGIWMSQLIPDKEETMGAIYDVRIGFGPKDNMSTIGANKLNRNDIIFVEAYITRYQHSDDVIKVQRYKEDWSSTAYRMSLELVSIALLKSVPRT
ncbi:hypothetical protein QCA50_018876 [Cerrena zonata]|uniref:Uncharacterized protein n=1 Tax=Cerrena zonata TaxID=2478898 RepID=A0AAW0FA95_9APHY